MLETDNIQQLLSKPQNLNPTPQTLTSEYPKPSILLTAQVLEADNIQSTQKLGTLDPYVVISMKGSATGRNGLPKCT